MSSNPCQICGCTELNLVDGFYYCVECGTQDVNIRETIVEKTLIADYGTAMVTDARKITTVLKDAVQMSGEWCKWHSYNFILVNLADELIALGAKSTVKLKVLWIWLRYVKKFQKKDEPEATIFENIDINTEGSNQSSDTDDKLDQSQYDGTNESKNNNKGDKCYQDIKFVTSSMLLAILYIALNLDRSDIQLNHLLQYIREGRLSVFNCFKFVPKELSFKSTPNFINFENSTKHSYHGGCSSLKIRHLAMTLFKKLDLGIPLVPDLNKIINNYITELCLPNDFKDLVLSLTNLMPFDFIEMDNLSMKYSMRTPDYEAYCMSYVLLALKMCFGLDSEYEVKLSEAVDKLNCEENYLKCYNFGMHSEPSDRLFSFREWYIFLQFRRITLSKHYLPMASEFHMPADDCVFMEHSDKRKTQHMKLSYDVAMDILNKIPSNDNMVIPKEQFPVTLTPMNSYTQVIKEYINESDLKLLLSEDFTQYSMKYATKDLKLPGYINTNCTGVDEMNKIINPALSVGTMTRKKGDTNLVLVRNCENKNWLKTRPPKIKHVNTINRSKNRYGSICRLTSESEHESENEDDLDKEICDLIEEEDEQLSIFNDDFKNLQIGEDNTYDPSHIEDTIFKFHSNNLNESKTVLLDSKTEVQETTDPSLVPENFFDPATFDREKVIKELIEVACKKLKIPIPKKNVARISVKRKTLESSEPNVSEPKKKKTCNRMKRGELAKMSLELINAYYENLNNDLSDVKSVAESIENQTEINTEFDAVSNVAEYRDAPNQSKVTQSDDENRRENSETIVNFENSSFHDNIQDDTANSAIANEKEFDIAELLPKLEPKFDPKLHDIKQLYLDVKEKHLELNFDNIDNDSDINDIINKKIEEFRDLNVSNDDVSHDSQIENDKDTESKDSEDITISRLILEEELHFNKKSNVYNLEYLIQNKNIVEFKYWMKHYSSKYFNNVDFNQRFNKELSESCPKSFVFVINECACISNSSAFSLYSKLNYLENVILGHIS